VKESVDILKFVTLSGSWKKLCPEAVNDCWGFPNQQDKLKNIHLLACKILREGHFLRRLISMRFLIFMLLTELGRT